MKKDSTQERLLQFARSECLPWLQKQETIAPYGNSIAFLLVGSVATGLCREDSDVDIALVCSQQIYEDVSKDTRWEMGRPTEVILKGTQLHYYGMPLGRLENKLHELDDVYIYVYGNALVLKDDEGLFEGLMKRHPVNSREIWKTRTEGKLDMLLRRRKALKHSIESGDPIAFSTILLEFLVRCLKVTALLDHVPFDPRKHLFSTALSGSMGKKLQPLFKDIFTHFSLGSSMPEADEKSLRDLYATVDEVLKTLKAGAAEQDCRTSLEKPDPRFLK